MNKLIFFFVMLALLCGMQACIPKSDFHFVDHSADGAVKTKRITFRDLVRDYKTLHGQYIETTGHLTWTTEEVSICRQDDENDSRDCFGIEIRTALTRLPKFDRLGKATGYQFTIKGKVDTSRRTPSSGALATIDDIYYLRIK